MSRDNKNINLLDEEIPRKKNPRKKFTFELKDLRQSNRSRDAEMREGRKIVCGQGPVHDSIVTGAQGYPTRQVRPTPLPKASYPGKALAITCISLGQARGDEVRLKEN